MTLQESRFIAVDTTGTLQKLVVQAGAMQSPVDLLDACVGITGIGSSGDVRQMVLAEKSVLQKAVDSYGIELFLPTCWSEPALSGFQVQIPTGLDGMTLLRYLFKHFRYFNVHTQPHTL